MVGSNTKCKRYINITETVYSAKVLLSLQELLGEPSKLQIVKNHNKFYFKFEDKSRAFLLFLYFWNNKIK